MACVRHELSVDFFFISSCVLSNEALVVCNIFFYPLVRTYLITGARVKREVSIFFPSIGTTFTYYFHAAFVALIWRPPCAITNRAYLLIPTFLFMLKQFCTHKPYY